MNRFKIWIMRRYCPEFEEKIPEDAPGKYRVCAVIFWGYWGHYWKEVGTKVVEGRRKAYLEARWIALKAQWVRPQMIERTGINYAVTEIK